MGTISVRLCRRTAAMVGLWAAGLILVSNSPLLADGMAVGPKLYKGVPYEGSVEERAQEAIIIFHGSGKAGEAREDIILKISVRGEVEHFAWVVPFPDQPQVAKEDPALFKELHEYVEARLRQLSARPATKSEGAEVPSTAERPQAPVEVLSRKIVGAFDVAVVRESQPGALNGWLEKEGYQTLSDADNVLDFYREKEYVYACIKVSDAQLSRDTPVDLHPLRFSFKTGGRDGMYFPMRMTGLQNERFDVNLFIFYKAWVNDHLSKFGYEHRGFRRKYRDWDTPACRPNAGKTYSTPRRDVFLKNLAPKIPTVAKLFQKLHPGERYYLTNIFARGLVPERVRDWSDDLWLFPYYIDRSFVPYDARPGGPASAAWPNQPAAAKRPSSGAGSPGGFSGNPAVTLLAIGLGVGVLLGVLLGVGVAYARGTWPIGREPKAMPDSPAADRVR